MLGAIIKLSRSYVLAGTKRGKIWRFRRNPRGFGEDMVPKPPAAIGEELPLGTGPPAADFLGLVQLGDCAIRSETSQG
jgi:hypothetical protein